MTISGLIIALLWAVLAGSAGMMLGFPITMGLIGVGALVLSILYKVNNNTFNDIRKYLNIDRYNAYLKKDEAFKKVIKDSAATYFLIGLIALYFSYKSMGQNYGYKGLILLVGFIIANYFIETYSMVRSKTWEQYNRKNTILTIVIVLIFIAVFRN